MWWLGLPCGLRPGRQEARMGGASGLPGLPQVPALPTAAPPPQLPAALFFLSGPRPHGLEG